MSQALQKPREVSIAATLIWVTVLADIAFLLKAGLHAVDVTVLDSPVTVPGWIGLIYPLFVLLLGYCIYKGKNWARLLFVILFLVGLVRHMIHFSEFLDMFKSSVFFGVLMLFTFIARFIAMYMLMSLKVRNYFRQPKIA